MTALTLDDSHDPGRMSWVDSANDGVTDFPIQNLPLGVARDSAGELTGVVAIGDHVLDLARAARARMLDLDPELVRGPERLNRLLRGSPSDLTQLRHGLVKLLERGSAAENAIRADGTMFRSLETVELSTPTRIGSFTDFSCSIHHARNAGSIMGGRNLVPNYRWLPIAYQSRASTVRPSGAGVRRPWGQLPGRTAPVFAPSASLDFELEVGFYVGPGTTAGEPVPVARAAEHIAGFCLVNDWSARDIQRWESAPLGPFLSKSFGTTISPWIVTSDALRPFRVPVEARTQDDPRPLPHLHDEGDQAAGALAAALTVWLRTSAMRDRGEAETLLLRSNAAHLYWTPAQMLAHHVSGGCDLQPGDLLATGTVSGPTPQERACLLELTGDGHEQVTLPDGESRGYLEDGDEVIFTGRCVLEGFASIGFGQCAGMVVPAKEES